MKRRKTDVEQHGSDSLMVFLLVMGIGYAAVFIYNYLVLWNVIKLLSYIIEAVVNLCYPKLTVRSQTLSGDYSCGDIRKYFYLYSVWYN